MAFLTRKKKILLIEIALIIGVFLLTRGYSQRDLVSGMAPVFTATTLEGKPVTLADYQGKPVLVHFWASWCPVCKLEQDSIQSVSQDYPVITVAMQSGNDLEVTAYMKENQLSFPTIIDEHGTLAKQYGVRGVPASFILSPSGQIKFSEVGYTTEPGLRVRLWLAQE